LLGNVGTNRKIHEAKETEPKTPDRASWGVRCSIAARAGAPLRDMVDLRVRGGEGVSRGAIGARCEKGLHC
jgi:hypothetical protein